MKFQQGLKLGIIGYGEVGSIFAAALQKNGAFSSICVWDIKLGKIESALALQQKASIDSVQLCASAQQLAEQCDILISAVTAANTLAVAQELSQSMRAGQVFIDINSASPGTKKQAAQYIQACEAHYVDAGVMTSVPPHGIQVPILLGGTTAAEVSVFLNQLGMKTRAVSTEIGVASAIKMCRSIMIKGLEALVIESYTTARSYGVEDQVLPTLVETFPSIDWSQQGSYFFSRVVQHGQRRAEEMREAANTVRESGFEPTMAAAIAQKHQFIADQAKNGIFNETSLSSQTLPPWQSYADALVRNVLVPPAPNKTSSTE